MSQIVIDASIALGFLLPDESSQAAVTVQDELLKAERSWVPAHWKLEVCNAVRSAERRNRLNPAGVAQAVFLISQLPVEIDPETSDRAELKRWHWQGSMTSLFMMQRTWNLHCDAGPSLQLWIKSSVQ